MTKPTGAVEGAGAEQQASAGGENQSSNAIFGQGANQSGASGGADPNSSAAGNDGNNDLIGAPDGYAVYVVPENVKLDDGMVTELNTLAKSMNLSQAGVQKLVDLQVKQNVKQEEIAQAKYKEMVRAWETETKKELGEKYDSEMVYVQKILNACGSPELVQLLEETGIGKHKIMVAFLRKAGNKISEDAPAASSGASGEKSAADVLFGGA